MSINLSAQALMSVGEAKRYLESNGLAEVDEDILKVHINAATGFILNYCSRKRLKWISSDFTEYQDGDGSNMISVRETPIKSVTSVVLNPHWPTSAITITGPTSPALQTDDMLIDARLGRIMLKSHLTPDSFQSVQIDYRPGYYDNAEPTSVDSGDPELLELKLLALEALAKKWKRRAGNRWGLASATTDKGTVVYELNDFPRHVKSALDKHAWKVA